MVPHVLQQAEAECRDTWLHELVSNCGVQTFQDLPPGPIIIAEVDAFGAVLQTVSSQISLLLACCFATETWLHWHGIELSRCQQDRR